LKREKPLKGVSGAAESRERRGEAELRYRGGIGEGGTALRRESSGDLNTRGTGCKKVAPASELVGKQNGEGGNESATKGGIRISELYEKSSASMEYPFPGNILKGARNKRDQTRKPGFKKALVLTKRGARALSPRGRSSADRKRGEGLLGGGYIFY